MKFTLRDYQRDGVDSIYKFFKDNPVGNPIVAMPTGSGKSIVIAEFLRTALQQAPKRKILVITHSKKLIQQDYDKLLSIWPEAPAGINSAGLGRRDYGDNIIFCGVASICKKWELFGKIALVLIDEAHLVSPTEDTMYKKLLDNLKGVNPKLRVVGFTATPWRTTHGRLDAGPVFTHTCFDLTKLESFNKLITDGYLCEMVSKLAKTQIDLTDVKTTCGEYNQADLQRATDLNSITEGIVRESLQYKDSRKKWIIFCAGVDHAIHVSEMYNTYGISCAVIHSKMSDSAQTEVMYKFEHGDQQAICNYGVLTTGVDIPGIDLIILLRATKASCLLGQMVGRGFRTAAGKLNCLVLDCGTNIARLGPVNDPIIPRGKGDSKGGGEAPVRLCPKCDTYSHATVKVCKVCGYEFPVNCKLTLSPSELEIIKTHKVKIKTVDVSHITYSIHKKKGGPDFLKATYFYGILAVSEYISVERLGYARRLAELWWKQHTYLALPATAELALKLTADFKIKPSQITIDVSDKYPRVKKLIFPADSNTMGLLT